MVFVTIWHGLLLSHTKHCITHDHWLTAPPGYLILCSSSKQSSFVTLYCPFVIHPARLGCGAELTDSSRHARQIWGGRQTRPSFRPMAIGVSSKRASVKCGLNLTASVTQEKTREACDIIKEVVQKADRNSLAHLYPADVRSAKTQIVYYV